MYIESRSGAMLDEADVHLITGYTWFAHHEHQTTYALTNLNRDGKTSVIYMHQLILPPRAGFEIDHRDRNGLNNQRSNLRYATHSQNIANQNHQSRGASKYRGVTFDKRRKKCWRAKIVVNQETIWLGAFEVEEDAAMAYNVGALKYFGEFANLNAL